MKYYESHSFDTNLQWSENHYLDAEMWIACDNDLCSKCSLSRIYINHFQVYCPAEKKPIKVGDIVQPKIGDVVQLKSGSPKMTVQDPSVGGYVSCVWMDVNNQINKANFPAECLITQEEINRGFRQEK